MNGLRCRLRQMKTGQADREVSMARNLLLRGGPAPDRVATVHLFLYGCLSRPVYTAKSMMIVRGRRPGVSARRRDGLNQVLKPYFARR